MPFYKYKDFSEKICDKDIYLTFAMLKPYTYII